MTTTDVERHNAAIDTLIDCNETIGSHITKAEQDVRLCALELLPIIDRRSGFDVRDILSSMQRALLQVGSNYDDPIVCRAKKIVTMYARYNQAIRGIDFSSVQIPVVKKEVRQLYGSLFWTEL